MKNEIWDSKVFLLTAVIFVSSCGPGIYGYSKTYSPLKDEKVYYDTAREFTYAAVASRPQDFKDYLLGWFGIVESITPSADGRYLVKMQFHKHRARHLCDGETKSTCRVTVNQRSTGVFTVKLKIREQDLVPGLDKIQPKTLIRVYGKPICKKNADNEFQCEQDEQGGVVLEGEYYRQWPARHYRTTLASDVMVR